MHQRFVYRRTTCTGGRQGGAVCERTPPFSDVARRCRSCGATVLRPVLDLGILPSTTALAEAAVSARHNARRPLVLVFCSNCALVQTLPGLHVDEPSGARTQADPRLDPREQRLSGVAARPFGPRSLVVGIGSDDVSMLHHLARAGITVLGVGSSSDAALTAAAAGVPTVTEPFDRELATKLREGGIAADVIIASRVLDVVEDLNEFVEGLRILVADRGTIVVETPYVLDVMDRLALSAIQHDRRSYFSCSSLDALVRRHGLFLNDVEHLRGGPVARLRCVLEPSEALTERCEALLDAERARGVRDVRYYEEFDARAHSVLRELHDLLRSLRADGHSIAAYGAGPGSATLLNASDIGADVDFVVECDESMHGLQVPGARVPIVAPETLRQEDPDYLLMLPTAQDAWHRFDQDEFLALGGSLIVLDPSPKVVGAPR